MSTHKVSVAMCTYNGSPYLLEQLHSITTQTRPPDELIICDDCSTDHTPDLLEQFSLSTAIPTRVFINPHNLGPAANFEQAISLCRGDLIFLADQDDVWLSDKVEAIIASFDSSLSPVMVFTDAYVVDSHLRSLGYRLWESIGFSPGEQHRFARGGATRILLKHNVSTGATMAFRRAACEFLLPIDPAWLHDAWISLLLSAAGDCVFIDRPLIYYRQHIQQQIGGARKTFTQRIINSRRLTAASFRHVAHMLLPARQRLQSMSYPNAAINDAVRLINEKISHFTARAELLEGKSSCFVAVAREWISGRYGRYSIGLHSMVRDLLSAKWERSG